MADKVYCIVQLGDCIYVPIKAEKNPYNGKESYLKNLPNFFGGTKDAIEFAGGVRNTIERTPAKALSDELREESRNNINVDEYDIAVQMTDDNVLLSETTADGQYWYGLIRIQENHLKTGANRNFFNFMMPSQKNSENEMKYVVKVPIANVIKDAEPSDVITTFLHSPIDQIDQDEIDRFAGKVLSACSMLFEQGQNPQYFWNMIQDPSNQNLRNEWNASKTRKAFAKLAIMLYSRNVH